jgi:hypothetical protein
MKYRKRTLEKKLKIIASCEEIGLAKVEDVIQSLSLTANN